MKKIMEEIVREEEDILNVNFYKMNTIPNWLKLSNL